jgi:hypothetical protein
MRFRSTRFYAACSADSPTAEGGVFAGGACGIEALTFGGRKPLELLMPTIDTLRSRLLEVAGVAREQHIDERMERYAASRAEVEAILEQLREHYTRDATPFDEEFLADIRAAKICARIMTWADLDGEAIERERRSIIAAHEGFLRGRGLPNRGTRLGLGHRRITHCYNCKSHLDNAVDVECSACGWIVCHCGACGCGYSGAG